MYYLCTRRRVFCGLLLINLTIRHHLPAGMLILLILAHSSPENKSYRVTGWGALLWAWFFSGPYATHY